MTVYYYTTVCRSLIMSESCDYYDKVVDVSNLRNQAYERFSRYSFKIILIAFWILELFVSLMVRCLTDHKPRIQKILLIINKFVCGSLPENLQSHSINNGLRCTGVPFHGWRKTRIDIGNAGSKHHKL